MNSFSCSLAVPPERDLRRRPAALACAIMRARPTCGGRGLYLFEIAPRRPGKPRPTTAGSCMPIRPSIAKVRIR